MASKKIGIVIALDGEKQFAQQIQNANKETGALKAELKNLKEEFDGNANSMEYLTKKQDILTRQQSVYQKKLDGAQNGLKKARDNYDQQTKRLQELENEFGSAKEKLEAFKKANNIAGSEYKKQEKLVSDLEEAIEKQTFVRNKEIGSIAEWTKKINNSEADLTKLNREISKNESYVKEADGSIDKCAKSIDRYGKAVKEATPITMTLKESIKDGLGEAIGGEIFEAVKAGVNAVKDSMYDISKASASFAAQTGLTGSALEKYKDVMLEIRGNNFGEDYADVSSVMAEIVQIMGELDPSNMQATTESAIALRDTFGMDVNEQIRAVDVMMKTLGVDATQAFNLITTGAQRGLNRSGELVDNITEYGQLWGQAGFSAEEMFAIMENGLDAGAYNLDKVNDYVKEFGNSLADGRIEKNLDSFSADTQKLFDSWKNGEATTSDVFYSVIDDLSEMTSQQEALTLASEVWSALGEDNAMQVITALNNVNTAYSNVKGAAESLKEVSYSDLESSVTGFGAAIQENILTPIGESVLPLIQGAVETATAVIEGMGGSIDPQQEKINTLITSVIEANEELATTLEAADTTVKDAETEAERIQILGEQLIALNSVEEKSMSQKYQMKNIVEELGTAIPEIAAAYDEEAGKVHLSDAATRDLIGSTKELIIAQAAQNAMQEVANELIEARIALSEAETAKDTASDKAAMYQEEAQLLQELKAGYAEYETAVSNASRAGADAEQLKEIEASMVSAAEVERRYLEFWDQQLKSGRATIEEYNAALENVGILELDSRIEDNKNNCDQWNETLKSASSSFDELNANVEAAEDKVDTYNTAAQESVEALTKAGEAAGEAGSAYSKAKEGMDASTGALEGNAEAAKANAEAQKNAADAILEAYHGYVDEIKADLQDKISLFDKFDTSDGGEDMTVEDMTANLDSQIAAFEEYQENLAAVKDHVGKEIAPEFMQYLEGMGMEGANTLKHILATFEDNEPDKVKEMSDKWVEAMNISEDMAEVGAANKLAYEAAMGELGSTDAEFSELSSAIEGSISGELKTALENAAKTAQDMGIKIPEGLTEGIASGDIEAEDAIAQLTGSMQGAFDGLAEVAKEAGLSGVDELAAGIASGETTVQEAYQTLIASLKAQTTDLETTGSETGSNAGDNIVSGLEGKTEDVSNAMDAVAQAGADAASNKATFFYEAGAKSAAEYLRGIQEAQAKATVAGNALATAVKTAISSQTGFFGVGNNISASVALGIQYGSSGAINAARNMAANALAAAKAELQIASPSKRFRKEVGQNISESTAFGIKDKAALAGRAAKRMSNKVYTNAVSWLSAYKKKQQVSLADEKWYWQQVLEHTKKGTTAYNKALKKIQNITVSELTASGLSSSVATKITDNFGVSKKTGSGKKKKNKDTETYYSEVYSAAQKYLSNQQVLNDWSLDQELTYWNAVKGQLKKGTQAWYDAQKQINGLQADIEEAEARAAEEKLRTHADVQDDILDKYKTYYKVSAKAEADYWNIARKQFKAGTDERIEADQKYYDALQEFYDERRELDEEYAKNSKDINDELIESIQDLQDAYHDAVQSRKEDILSSMNLFESWDTTGYDADTLLHNLQTQVAGLALWEQQLEELGKKGLTDGLMEELRQMGPDAAANIYSLNQMTAEQLKEYNKLWEQKDALAESQAVKDNADLLKETNAEISQLRKDAKSELELLTQDYKAAVKELNTGISDDLKNLVKKAGTIGAEAVSALIAKIDEEATSVETYNSTIKATAKIESQLKKVSAAGETIGKKTLQNILDQLTDETKISTAAKSVAESIKNAMVEELAYRQDAMNELNSIGNGGVVMLNNMTKAYGSQQTVVSVDNSGVIATMQQITGGLQILINLLQNSQMVLDTGVVAAELQPLLSQENASAALRTNRGLL